jgi:hypothetical protein
VWLFHFTLPIHFPMPALGRTDTTEVTCRVQLDDLLFHSASRNAERFGQSGMVISGRSERSLRAWSSVFPELVPELLGNSVTSIGPSIAFL